MVKLNKIYTRTGDSGETGLVGGARVSKADPRVEAYGTVDEAMCAIGIVRALLNGGEGDEALTRIQQDLFDLGADLATPDSGNGGDLRIVQQQVDRLEAEIDAMNASLTPLESFLLPGGSVEAAQLHLARAIVRRAERLAVALSAGEKVNSLAVRYLNRLSDHLFVLARLLNRARGGDVLWQPGINR